MFGDLPCKTDTYELLAATLVPPLERGIKQIIHKEVCSGVTPDGSLFMFPTTGEVRFSIKDEDLPAGAYKLPFRVMMSGDLGFYALCLGKDGASGAWCYLCDLAKKLWQECGHSHGNLWTLDGISAVLSDLGDEERNKGVVMKPLLTVIDVDQFMIPFLHALLGVGNDVLKSTAKFINELDGLERLPAELRQLRHAYFDVLSKLVDAKQELDVWSQLDGQELVNLRLARSVAIQLIKASKDEWDAEQKRDAMRERSG